MQTKPIQIDLIENEPRVSAMTIANNSNVKYESIRELIRKYKLELEDFGEIPTADFKSAVGKVAKQLHLLNEQQATLLITFLKNTKEVVEFKKNLVKAFFLMKEKLQKSNQVFPNENILSQILQSNQETTNAIVQMGKNMEAVFKSIIESNNNLNRLRADINDKLDITKS